MRFVKYLCGVASIAMASAAIAQSPAPGPAPASPARVFPPSCGFTPTCVGWSVRTVRPGKVYVVFGGGGTSTVIVGDKGVIVVDPKTDMASGTKLIETVATLTPKPITHIVQTHSDCDHTNGAIAFPPSVKIIADVHNLIEQQQTLRFGTRELGGGSGMPFQERLPNVLIRKEKVDTRINGVRMVFYHFGPAHTSGDLLVYLPDEKIVAAGDVVMYSPGPAGLPAQNRGLWWKFEKNGSIEGWFKNIDGLLGLDADTYIPGHGDEFFTKAKVRQLRADLQSDKDRVDAMAAAGKSLAEIRAAFNDAAYAERAGLPADSPAVHCPRGIAYLPFTTLEYNEWVNKALELKN